MKGNSYFIPTLIPKEIQMLGTYYFLAFTEYSEIFIRGKTMNLSCQKIFRSVLQEWLFLDPQFREIQRASGHITLPSTSFPYFFLRLRFYCYHKWLHSVLKEYIKEGKCVGLMCLRQRISNIPDLLMHSEPSPFEWSLQGTCQSSDSWIPI